MPMGGGGGGGGGGGINKIIRLTQHIFYLTSPRPTPTGNKNGRSKRSRGPTVERITLTLTDIRYLLLLYHT